jgi:hypothetical protein
LFSIYRIIKFVTLVSTDLKVAREKILQLLVATGVWISRIPPNEALVPHHRQNARVGWCVAVGMLDAFHIV